VAKKKKTFCDLYYDKKKEENNEKHQNVYLIYFQDD
jgi:hypothetical protein